MKEPAWSLLAAFKSSCNGQAGSFMSAPFNILAHLYFRPPLCLPRGTTRQYYTFSRSKCEQTTTSLPPTAHSRVQACGWVIRNDEGGRQLNGG